MKSFITKSNICNYILYLILSIFLFGDQKPPNQIEKNMHGHSIINFVPVTFDRSSN